MIEPLPKGEPYPGRMPSPRDQWLRLARASRTAIVGVPIVVVAILFISGIRPGVVGTVMVLGVGAASAVYVKNRTDRHNAAVDRGEIRIVPDPHLQRAAAESLDSDTLRRVATMRVAADDIGAVTRFDGGWLVKRRNPRDVAIVVGDDGGCAYFDPRWVDDLRAASEYRAGRGRECAGGAS